MYLKGFGWNTRIFKTLESFKTMFHCDLIGSRGCKERQVMLLGRTLWLQATIAEQDEQAEPHKQAELDAQAKASAAWNEIAFAH